MIMTDRGHQTWGGRFTEAPDQLVQRFTSSVGFDRRLFLHDIRGSIAHARMLARVGVLTDKERDTIIEGLEDILVEIERGEFAWLDELEDVHMNIEARLTDRIGEVGKKLHTGRSRNDQVATDLRLLLRDELDGILADISRLREGLIGLAEREADTIMPGFTHLQVAQPVTFGHHMLAWEAMLTRDAERLLDARSRINVLPLGSAALAGTTFPIDREYVAELLGFDSVAENSLDAVSDRDFAIEFLAAAAQIMTHLSRMSEELVLWMSPAFGFVDLPDRYCTGSSIMPQKKNPDVAELVLWMSPAFGFVDLPDRYCTGSSIMPQKKNPDVAELVRGKTARVTGHLMSLLTLMKGQPLAYTRDNQEDKEPLFDTLDTLRNSLRLYADMAPNMRVDADACERAARRGFATATDLADYLVRKNVPFRTAHEIVGKAVKHAIDAGCDLAELDLDTLKGFSKHVEGDVYEILTLDGSVAARNHIGGTAPAQVRAAAERARERL